MTKIFIEKEEVIETIQDGKVIKREKVKKKNGKEKNKRTEKKH